MSKADKQQERRCWGYWTRVKLDVLHAYLDAFTTASKNKSDERIYLDLFAGGTENVDRRSGEEFVGSAEIALEIDNPPFTQLRFIDNEHAEQLQNSLLEQDRERAVVTSGDCNDKIDEVLSDLSQYNWAPTFAFIDPNGPDCHWATLEALARFKKTKYKKAKYKTEIWLLFADGMFTRNLPLDGNINPAEKEKMTRMFGTEDWGHIYKARRDKRLDPPDARTEYVNLMQWNIEKQLRYKWTHILQVFNEQNSPLYHLIFATDNEAGNRIMAHLYKRALEEFPRMREEAKELGKIRDKEKEGQGALFDAREVGEVESAEIAYAPEPPRDPHQTTWYPR